MKKGYIYILSYGDDIFYVGSTMNLAVRLYHHENNAKTDDSLLYQYIRNIGKTPSMECIEEVVFEKVALLRREEKYWIEQFRQWGYKLKNVSDNVGTKRNQPIPKPSVKGIDRVLTGKEVQKILHISRVTLWKLSKEGLLKAYQIGGQNRYKQSDIERMMR
jgi:predicted GIY-YIG superfamily endonuclease/predicted DNA-binding transcriptional regulator AlpA